MTSFSGLYYPGEHWDLDAQDYPLMESLLFFDKIYAIIPEIFSVDWKSVQPSEELPPSLGKTRNPREDELVRIKEAVYSGKWPTERKEPNLLEIDGYIRITRFLDKVKVLRHEEVLELVDPQQNLLDSLEGQGPDILHGSALNDIMDEEFRAAAANLGNEPEVLCKGRTEQDWLAQLGGSSGFPEDEWQWVPSSGFCGDLVGIVSKPVWAAFIINQALLTAHKHNLILVTPSHAFHSLLQSKINRLQTHPANDHSRFTLAITLPSLHIDSFEDTMELRLVIKDELSPLREQMAAMWGRIRTKQWNSNLEGEIEHITKHGIDPAVQEFQRRLTSSTKQAVRRVLASSVPATLTMLVNIWIGLPPLLVMALSAGDKSEKITTEYHKNDLQSNGISILLQRSQGLRT